MPIFEYRCQECGTKFEKLVRSSDAAGPNCPSCGTSAIEKQLSTFAAHAHSRSESARGVCPSTGNACPNPGVCGLN